MLAIQGYFESGRFITGSPIQIPERKKTIITVLDENVDEDHEPEAHEKLWDEIIEGLRTCDEVLEGEPERLRFRTPEETDAL
jgi:chorismate mutase